MAVHSLLLIVSVLIFSAKTLALPGKSWLQFTSEDKTLIFDAEQQELAVEYWLAWHRAEQKLRPLWGSFTRRQTLVLLDTTDLTNGYATPLPYPHVVVFPVLPGPSESIGEFGNWPEELLIHEFVHIHTFEKRRGIVAALAKVFGNIMVPNVLLPRWWHEGLAVDAETRLSRHGRLRSWQQQASLRALSQTSEWLSLDRHRANQFAIPTFPFGNRPYLYGSLLWSEMIAKYGESIVLNLHERLGGRAPYATAGPVADLTGGSHWDQLLWSAKNSLTERVEKQKKDLGTKPFSQTTRLETELWRESLQPTLSPDGLKLAFIARDSSLKRSIQILQRDNPQQPFSMEHHLKSFGQKREVQLDSPGVALPRTTPDGPPGGTIQRLSWAANSQTLLFDRLGEPNIYEDRSDLWQYSLATGKAEQLSNAMRAREPAANPVHPHLIAFVKVQAGRTGLGLFDANNKSEKLLYQGELSERVSWPTWINATQVLFNRRRQGVEQLVIIDIATKQQTNLSFSLREPLFGLVEQNTLYLTSTQNGVRNVYRIDDFASSNPRITPLTHLWTGTASFAIDQTHIWVSEFTADGIQLSQTSALATTATLPTTEQLYTDRYPATATNPSDDTAAKVPQAEGYQPLGYLWPRYWIPFIAWDNRTTRASVSTGGFDPLKRHLYSATAQYDTALQDTSYTLLYLNNSFWPLVGIGSSRIRSFLVSPEDETLTQSEFITLATTPKSWNTLWTVGGRYQQLRRSQLNSESKANGPGISLTYGKVSQSGEQVSPESGTIAKIAWDQFSAQDSLDRYQQGSLMLTQYGRLPWARHHAWMISASGRYRDRTVRVANFDQSIGYQGGLVAEDTMMFRGIETGGILAKNWGLINAEYRFPLLNSYRAPIDFPFFVKRFSGALITDAIWFDGFLGLNREGRVERYARINSFVGNGIASAGAELKMDFTLGHHLELQLVWGVYQALPNVADRLGYKSTPLTQVSLLATAP